MEVHAWEIKFEELKTFKNNFNRFPTYKENNTLYKWLIGQRNSYIKGTLKPERITKLEELGYNFQ